MEATRDINRHDFLDNSNIGNWMTVLMTKVACTKDSAEMSINNRSYLFILPFQMEHLVHPFFFPSTSFENTDISSPVFIWIS